MKITKMMITLSLVGISLFAETYVNGAHVQKMECVMVEGAEPGTDLKYIITYAYTDNKLGMATVTEVKASESKIKPFTEVSKIEFDKYKPMEIGGGQGRMFVSKNSKYALQVITTTDGDGRLVFLKNGLAGTTQSFKCEDKNIEQYY